MRIRIDDITKGTFSLPIPIETRERRLRIGVKSIGYWVGFYNVYEEQICRWARAGENSIEFKIKPGFYSFKDIAKLLTRQVGGLDLSLDKMTGLIDLTVPANIEVWLTEPIKYLNGLMVHMMGTDLWNLYPPTAYLFIWMTCQLQTIYHRVNQEISNLLTCCVIFQY